MNLLKDFMEQGSQYQNLGHLKGHIASMLDNLGSDLDQLFPHGPQRPIPYGLGQRQPPQKVTEIIGQSEQLKANLIIHEIMAGKPCPLQGIFTFLDPLFGCATLVVKLHHVA